MRKCKHENADHLKPGDFWNDAADVCFGPYIAAVEQLRCVDCGAWLPLGESNDSDPAVQVELSAAERFAAYHDENYRPGVDRFDYCPTNKSDELCDLCESLYLAHCICNHDENRETE